MRSSTSFTAQWDLLDKLIKILGPSDPPCGLSMVILWYTDTHSLNFLDRENNTDIEYHDMSKVWNPISHGNSCHQYFFLFQEIKVYFFVSKQMIWQIHLQMIITDCYPDIWMIISICNIKVPYNLIGLFIMTCKYILVYSWILLFCLYRESKWTCPTQIVVRFRTNLVTLKSQEP